ncbi:MAG: pyridoxal-phosphate dependent enzyme [Planctomycetota bacterium]
MRSEAREEPSPSPPAFSRLVCGGCGSEPPIDAFYPFRCPRAASGDDIDHVLRRVLIVAPESPKGLWQAIFARDDPSPFTRFRELLHSYDRALRASLQDGDYVDIVADLDRAVTRSYGHSVGTTPFHRSAGLSDRLGFATSGGLWIKDETGQVAGSHKARHLMGLLIWLAVVEGSHRRQERSSQVAPLAIASCGNAAFAAAVLARAVERALDVFVPCDADPLILRHLAELGGRVHPCARDGKTSGDPCLHRFREAVAAGALPFTVQGSENALAIEGGKTLAWEMIATVIGSGQHLDRIFVQVGGGALASAVVQAFEEAQLLGLVDRLPRIHAVQTEGGHPLQRGYEKLAQRIVSRCLPQHDTAAHHSSGAERAVLIRRHVPLPRLEAELQYTATHRSQFLWPWETPPHSIATGILDDETYDGLAILRGLVLSSGTAVVVSEERLREAHALARQCTGIRVDPTGSAGLAGCLALQAAGELDPRENVAVLFTGRERT